MSASDIECNSDKFGGYDSDESVVEESFKTDKMCHDCGVVKPTVRLRCRDDRCKHQSYRMCYECLCNFIKCTYCRERITEEFLDLLENK